MIVPSKGFAEFDVVYNALILKVFKNMVVDGIVTTVNKVLWFVFMYVTRSYANSHGNGPCAYTQLGFWAEVGPLQMFVSCRLIPPYMKFNSRMEPQAYVPEGEGVDPSLCITRNSVVRIRIIGIRNDAVEIFAVGTIREDYLGPQPN